MNIDLSVSMGLAAKLEFSVSMVFAASMGFSVNPGLTASMDLSVSVSVCIWMRMARTAKPDLDHTFLGVGCKVFRPRTPLSPTQSPFYRGERHRRVRFLDSCIC